MVFKITCTSMLVIPINRLYEFEIRVDQRNIPQNSDIQIQPSRKNVFNEMNVNFKLAFLQKQAQSQVWIHVNFFLELSNRKLTCRNDKVTRFTIQTSHLGDRYK